MFELERSRERVLRQQLERAKQIFRSMASENFWRHLFLKKVTKKETLPYKGVDLDIFYKNYYFRYCCTWQISIKLAPEPCWAARAKNITLSSGASLDFLTKYLKSVLKNFL